MKEMIFKKVDRIRSICDARTAKRTATHEVPLTSTDLRSSDTKRTSNVRQSLEQRNDFQEMRLQLGLEVSLGWSQQTMLRMTPLLFSVQHTDGYLL